MRLLKTDNAIYKVVYQKDGAIKVDTFNSFAAAAGCAKALTGITRFIDVTFESADSSWSGSLYKYNKLDNSRHVCNPRLIKAVLDRQGK